jgi:glycosyltransferase involved in cell wall biosynthesis
MAALAEQFRGDPRIEFLGYVPEESIAALFQRCNVAVLPYSSSGGPSGVAHMAAQFGLPLIAPPIADIINVTSEEGLAVEYYSTDDTADLADKIIALARDPERQRQMAEQNYNAALAMTMPYIVQQYLMGFNVSSEAGFQPCIPSLPEDPRAAA